MRKVLKAIAVAAAAALLLGVLLYFKDTSAFHDFDWRVLSI